MTTKTETLAAAVERVKRQADHMEGPRAYPGMTHDDQVFARDLRELLTTLEEAELENGNLNAVATETYARLRSERDAAEAETARLRAALANMVSLASPFFTDDVQRFAIEEARAALNGGSNV